MAATLGGSNFQKIKFCQTSPWRMAHRKPKELVLSLAHIGQTYLAHKYVLAREGPPFCISCHQIVSTLNELFKDINLKVVLQFLREVGLY